MALTLGGGGVVGYQGYVFPPRETWQRPTRRPSDGYRLAWEAAGRLQAQDASSPFRVPLADMEVLRESYRRERPHLAEVRRAMRLPFRSPLRESALDAVDGLERFRAAARGFTAESTLLAQEHQAGRALESALDALELGCCLTQGADTPHYREAALCAVLGVGQAERVTPQLTAAESRLGRQRLRILRRAWADPSWQFEEERRLMLTLLRDVSAGRISREKLLHDSQSGLAPFGRYAMPFEMSRWDWRIYPRAWAYRELDRGYREIIRSAREPYPVRRRAQIPAEHFSQQLLVSQPLELRLAARNEAHMALLEVELGLQEFRIRRGAYPSSMEQLAAELTEVEITDPLSGRPLRYQRQGDGFRLYSVGLDRRDNDGAPLFGRDQVSDRDGDIVARLLSSVPLMPLQP